MHIVISAGIRHGTGKQEVDSYALNLGKELAGRYRDDLYSFLYDQQPAGTSVEPNTRQIILKTKLRHPLLWKYWLDVKVPVTLRKIQADVLLSEGFCSLNTTIPQVIIIPDLSFLDHRALMSPFQRFYYKFYTPAFLRKAKRIITFSSVTKANITKHYPFIKNKIQVVPASPGNAFQPVDDTAKTQVKALYTGGREFFLCVAAGVGGG